jgi:hypothetical protein
MNTNTDDYMATAIQIVFAAVDLSAQDNPTFSATLSQVAQSGDFNRQAPAIADAVGDLLRAAHRLDVARAAAIAEASGSGVWCSCDDCIEYRQKV